jgi:hypothetical protein
MSRGYFDVWEAIDDLFTALTRAVRADSEELKEYQRYRTSHARPLRARSVGAAPGPRRFRRLRLFPKRLRAGKGYC